MLLLHLGETNHRSLLTECDHQWGKSPCSVLLLLIPVGVGYCNTNTLTEFNSMHSSPEHLLLVRGKAPALHMQIQVQGGGEMATQQKNLTSSDYNCDCPYHAQWIPQNPTASPT